MHSPDRHDVPGSELLRIARASIEHGAVHHEPLPVDCEGLPRSLQHKAATFTSLHVDGELRGCCGSLEAVNPIAVDTASSAFRAAYRDPRFDPVHPQLITDLHLEVSVLTPLEPISACSEEDLIGQLRPAIDGLLITAGPRRATFLPKVWETLPEPQRFVGALKVKCGLPDDYWSDEFEFFRYRTAAYTEPV